MRDEPKPGVSTVRRFVDRHGTKLDAGLYAVVLALSATALLSGNLEWATYGVVALVLLTTYMDGPIYLIIACVAVGSVGVALWVEKGAWAPVVFVAAVAVGKVGFTRRRLARSRRRDRAGRSPGGLPRD